ncbi:MAG: hypothetical protein RSN61_21310 [Chryseobacterium sp.]|uniref:hypothetical protein n=1 Tax=Chryseobacterium sp. TaxID=1871047 RepID=UPI002FCB8733
MPQTLGERLQANINRNNGMISREEHLKSLENNQKQAIKSLARNFIIEKWKLEIIYKIQREELVSVDTRDCRGFSGMYFSNIASLNESMISPEWTAFIQWITDNGLTVRYNEGYDDGGRESWVTLYFKPNSFN